MSLINGDKGDPIVRTYSDVDIFKQMYVLYICHVVMGIDILNIYIY